MVFGQLQYCDKILRDKELYNILSKIITGRQMEAVVLNKVRVDFFVKKSLFL
jgi:hypothetical protein